jgi:glycosyltransferase involved in cell wall biosynthesis
VELRRLVNRMPGLPGSSEEQAWTPSEAHSAVGAADGEIGVFTGDLGVLSGSVRAHATSLFGAALGRGFAAASAERADVVQIVFGATPPEGADGRLIVWVPDLLPVVYPDLYATGEGDAERVEAAVEAVRSAAHVVVPSEVGARDVVHRVGVPRERVTVLGHPPGRLTGPHRPEGAIVAPDVGPPHRLVDVLVRGYAHLSAAHRAAHPLVLGGESFGERARLRRVAREADVRVRLASAVPGVLDGARAAIFGGAYDPFVPGAAEAALRGVPIVAAAGNAAADLTQDPALIYEARDDEALARALQHALALPSRPGTASGWTAAADALRSVWRTIAAPGQPVS